MSERDLRAQVRRDAAAFRQRHLLAARWNATRLRLPFIRAALDAALTLLPQSRAARQANGDVVVPLSDGSVACLCLLASGEINGVASRAGDTYIAAVHDGAPRALFELAAALWADPRFCPQIGKVPVRRIPATSSPAVPRGLAYVAAVAALPWGSDCSRLMGRPLPTWLRRDLPSLRGIRKLAFERTFYEGVRFLFWHELAHVCAGHLGTPGPRRQEFDTVSEFPERLAGEANRTASRKQSAAGASRSASDQQPAGGLFRAFEIEADRLALDRLFAEAILRDRRKARSARGQSNFEVLLTSLGAALVPMVFHARRVFCDEPDAAVDHPPLWFRADEILRAESTVQAKMAGSAPEAADFEYSLHRFQERGQLARALISIGDLHPMLGQWLAPAAAPDREPAAAAVLEEARAAMKKHTARAPLQRRVPAPINRARNTPGP